MSNRSVLLLLALSWVVWYAVACRWWPYTGCLWCRGDGKRRSPSGKAWRRCKRCKGTGQRLRLGRWLLNHLTSTTRAASKAD